MQSFLGKSQILVINWENIDRIQGKLIKIQGGICTFLTHLMRSFSSRLIKGHFEKD